MDKLISSNYNKIFITLCLAAISSFFLTIHLPLIGEEGVYTNAALEMIFHKQYKFATLFGNIYPRPPMYNWLIILFSYIFGSKHIVVSARVVSLLATIIMGGNTFWLVRNLFCIDNLFSKSTSIKLALLATAIFFSGDILFKRGWLAYSDPAFAMFVFASTSCLLIATIKSKLSLLLFANIYLFLGFLCKVHTAYIFYGLTGLVLICSKYRKFLLTRQAILLHMLFASLPIVWSIYNSQNNHFIDTFSHIKKLLGINPNPEANISKNFLYMPLQLWLALLPSSLICLYGVKKLFVNNLTAPLIIKIIFAISILNFCPYWLAAQTHIRYIMPIYPWFAIIIGYIIWQTNLIKHTIVLLIIGIMLKYIVALFYFPSIYTNKYGNTATIAADILQRTNQQPLFINSFSAPGLRVGGAINQAIWPQQPLQQNPDHNLPSYFMIQEDHLNPYSDEYTHNLLTTYRLHKTKVFLYLYKQK